MESKHIIKFEVSDEVYTFLCDFGKDMSFFADETARALLRYSLRVLGYLGPLEIEVSDDR